MKSFASRLAALSLLLPAAAGAQEIVRHKIPNSDFPIALAVTLPPSATIHFISGQVPPVVNKTADPNSLAAFGDTRTQTVGVLNRIREILQGMGLGMGDVVKMQVFIVGDVSKGGRADVAGFMEGYTQFFGGAQPNLPARSVFQVAGLSNPGWLIEIEVTAAKK
ncbi:RidA family protein [Massilia sp. IC2-477]|uniref:RidA family protein n=1 Tax=Massilia sp. IC2-477 TaxID=2887198 RepID=UPI001D12C53A|nr:RidA family protein [Massilia sp. IC2-477]MCC2955738.1 RidA family protein [Massilia sp. IC2-477]